MRTSAGISWALGRPDGQGLTRDAMLQAVRLIAGAVRIPVTADMESGYGSGTPRDAAERARLWQMMVDVYPPYADYQRKAPREIPMVILEPTGG